MLNIHSPQRINAHAIVNRRFALVAILFTMLLPLPRAFAGGLRIVCVGDSITAGVGGTQEEAYPFVLQKLLGGSAEDVMNFGISGATLLKNGDSPYWTKQANGKVPLLEHVVSLQPDVVLLMLGTNDSKPKNWDKHAGEFTADYIEMVQMLRNSRSHPTVYAMLPIPAYGNGNFGITNPVIENGVIPAIRKAAAEIHIPIIDLHTPMKDQAALVPDRVHPSGAGYKLMAEAIAAALKERPKFPVRNDFMIDEQQVTIEAAAGTEIRFTTDGSLPTSSSTKYEGPITVKETTVITASVIADGKVGLPATATFTKSELAPATAPADSKPGIAYTRYQGKPGQLYELNWNEKILGLKFGTLPRIKLLPYEKETSHATRFTGYITIPADGVYTFATRSDQGSSLKIGEEVVVENGGLHGPRERKGRIALARGQHKIEVRHFHSFGEGMLQVFWEGPGVEREEIPESILRF